MPDDEVYAKRVGFWLRQARERAGKSQSGAAEFLGFSKTSKSTISDYETGRTVPSLRVLRRLADWYGVPLALLTNPRPTAEEMLDDSVLEGSTLEREGWDEEQAGLRAAEDERDAEPGTRTA
jgi:transcriptional regulator with XRE-family HTH domain